MTQPLRHLLSFDVEEYFQVEAVRRAGLTADQWPRFALRLNVGLDRILPLLDGAGTRATFFVLGSVAREQSVAIRRIVRAGHEIASHGMTHRMLTDLSPQAFEAELRDSRSLLEDLTGQAVAGFRAPTFSLVKRSAWAVDVLAETGYRWDSSVYPIRHDRYGVVDAPLDPHRATGPGGGEILELPPLVFPLGPMRIPAGGGGYLRLLPVRFIGRAIAAAARQGRAAMLYLHPWEFDPDQPRLIASPASNWRHCVNLGRTAGKLAWLLGRFEFTSVAEQLPALDDQARARYAYA
jgi:polysaccharide deacetylase family protein (PEP-CTERM system associated)